MRDGSNDFNWTGGYARAMAISPSDASPGEVPGEGDLETASLPGRRVAEFASWIARRKARHRSLVAN